MYRSFIASHPPGCPSVDVYGVLVHLCVHECVCESPLVQAPVVWKLSVLRKMGNFEAATHMILWEADRKGANCEISRCMLGTTVVNKWRRGHCFMTFKPDGTETGLRWLNCHFEVFPSDFIYISNENIKC